MASWSPQPAQLQEILQTIRDSTDTRNKVQTAITRKLTSFAHVPDYIAYLAHILATLPQEEERIRAIAGYILKNNASLILEASREAAEYAKVAVLASFNDASALVRTAAGQDIVALLGVLEPRHWPDCFQRLVGMLDDLNHQEAAFSVFENACEDFPRKLDIDTNGICFLDVLVPKFLMLSEHPSPRMRSHAIACLSYFVPIKSRSLFAHIDAFIVCLSHRALDEDPSVRRRVCQALPFLLGTWPEKLVPVMANVAEYMLYATKDENHGVALAACEFWLTFAEHPVLAPYLHPLLGRVAPALLDCMVYGDDDLRWLEEDEERTVPHKESDIKSRHYGVKTHKTVQRSAYSRETADDDEDGAEREEDSELPTEWSLRKCATGCLGCVGCQVRCRHDGRPLYSLERETCAVLRWLQRESAVVALGTMAEGRYTSWCTGPVSGDDKNQYFISTVEGLLRMLLDDNKHVQEAACKAFATFEHISGTKLCPYLEPILRSLVFALLKYRQKNMFIFSQWNMLQDDDADLIPLFKCLSSVVPAMGPGFAPYADLFFYRCVDIVHKSLHQHESYQKGLDLDEPTNTLLVASLDLLSSLVQGLGMSLELALSSTRPYFDIFLLLASCWMHSQPSVRQSAYALVGDLAIGCFTLLRPYLPALMPALILQLDPKPKVEFLSAYNNLAWSVGEIVLQYPRGDPEFQQWVSPLIDPSDSDAIIPRGTSWPARKCRQYRLT
ncbi:armadillo-type protein [Chiua virens]|nr:armadillo-type protein [Chiua virens]